jgi:hypothetical protein
MNADNVRRLLRQLRYSPRKGRRISIAWLAGQVGYGRTALYNAILTGHVTKRMADHVGTVFQNVQMTKDHVPLSSLAEYGAGADARGGSRPVRRQDDRRLRAARPLRGTSGTKASLGPHGARTENVLPRGPSGGGSAQIGPRGAGRRSKQTSSVTDELNAVKGPTNPVICIDVGRLLKEHLR